MSIPFSLNAFQSSKRTSPFTLVIPASASLIWKRKVKFTDESPNSVIQQTGSGNARTRGGFLAASIAISITFSTSDL